MAYQVTMDRTLSESEIDRLIQSELNRRKYNTKYTEETDEEFIEKWKTALDLSVKQFPSGRFRNIRWQDQSTGDASTGNARINPDDPLGLEAHPTENTCPIIFSSFCHPCSNDLVEGDGAEISHKHWFFAPDSMIEQMQNDWEMNGGNGDFRDKLGILGQAMWNDNPATGESSAEIVKRWTLLPHEKGFASDPEKISFVPVIEYFKSIGVTHQGYFILGERVKKFTESMLYKKNWDEEALGCQTINGKDREESPSDFPWPWQYGMSQTDGGELTFVVQYINCEDIIVNGPEHIRDYGWPGTK